MYNPKDDLQPDYRFDYQKAKPNRFVVRNNAEKLKVVVSGAQMIQPELLDVVELLADHPDVQLQADDQGTIVEAYDDHRAYEVEFANSQGEALTLLAIRSPRSPLCP
ncbi:MAG: DUF4926 domain-containing protein [Nodosilinea sp.]